AVDVRLTVTAPGGAHATAGTSARFVPWGAVTGTAAAVAAGAVAFAVRRRRRRHRPPEAGAPVGQPRPAGAVR
ncbi:hypothetical protein ABZX30_37935, partial [Streptomyces sp. NPDC004542]